MRSSTGSPAPIKRSSPSEEHSRYKRKPRPRDRDFNGPGCTAEDYAKLTGAQHPSMYHREPLCTPLICQRLHVPSTVKGQVDHTISRRCAAEYAPAARILCSTLRHGSRRPGAPRTHRPVAASSCAFNAQCAPGTRCGSGRSRPRRHCPAPRLGPLRAHANTASVAEQRTRTVAWPPDRGRVLSASRVHLPAAARTRQPADIFAKQSLTPLTHARLHR